MCLRGCISFRHSIPSRRNLQRCLDRYCRQRMNARISWRCLNKMRGFSSKSLTGYVTLEHSSAPLHRFSLCVKAFQAARLEPKLRHLALSVLRELCGRIGHLPESYLLSNKFDLSGFPRASGSSADVRMVVFRGKEVAMKSLRASAVDDKARIRKVGNQVTPSRLGSLTCRAAVL